MNGTKYLISIVIPVYNEELNVARAHSAVTAVMEPLATAYDYELIFTDNHSDDGTFEILEVIAQADPRVKILRFSKNVGFQQSILMGYAASQGDAAIQLDADLQDPPHLIPELLSHWRRGYDVVYGVRRNREEGRVFTAARRLYYRLVNALSEDDLPRDAGDFRLVSRRVLDVLKAGQDHHPYIRGTIASLGFPQMGVPYDREKRLYGKSKFSARQLVALALDGVLAHSIVPLRLATYVGLTAACVMVLAMVGYLVGNLAFGRNWPPGFATTTMLLLLGIALNAVFLGVIGEYVGRIYQQVRSAPHVLVERRVNFTE